MRNYVPITPNWNVSITPNWNVTITYENSEILNSNNNYVLITPNQNDTMNTENNEISTSNSNNHVPSIYQRINIIKSDTLLLINLHKYSSTKVL